MLLKVGGACNERCVFCHAADVGERDASTEDLFRKIDVAAERGFEMAVLSGGEPTIRPDLAALVDRVRSRRMSLGLVTNGRRFAYRKFADGLVLRGLAYVHLSLHGGDRETHDEAVQARSFDQAVQGLGNLVGRDVWITVNCVVSRRNLQSLDALVDLVVPLGVCLKLSFVEPKGRALDGAEPLVPRMEEAAEAIASAFARARAIDPGADVAFDGLPICLLPGEEHLWDDLRSNGILAMSESYEDRLHPVDRRDWVKTGRCDDCRHRGTCSGVHREYHARSGDSEVASVPGPRANSFDWILGRAMDGVPGAECPARGAPEPVDGRERSLFVAADGRLHLATTRTRDFDDEDVAAVRALGQVYLDRGAGPAPVDFACDLVALRPCPPCGDCDWRASCPGAWERAPGDPFAAAEAPVLDWIAGLAGRVLDVGCGVSRYLSTLRVPEVDYLGVDPDPGAVTDGLATLHVPIEDLSLAGRAVDHVLLLRSWNHLADPRSVVDRLLTAVRPGGTIAVADDVAFSLVRDPSQIERRDAAFATLGHGHLHLDDSHRALGRLDGLPLRVLAHNPVASGGATQWTLFMEKTR